MMEANGQALLQPQCNYGGPDSCTLLIVDDDADTHSALSQALAGIRFRGAALRMLHAHTAEEARHLLRTQADTAIALIDLSGRAGRGVIEFIRDELGNPFIRIVLVVPHPGQAPEQRVIEQYDINDCLLNTELTSWRLSIAVHSALSTHRHLMSLRRQQDELQDIDRRFRLMVDGVRDYSIYMLDAEGRVVTWNAGAERNTGYSADEIIGKPYSTLFTPDDIAAGKPARELGHAAATGQDEGEGWRVRKDGSRFWANVLLTALRDEKGRLIGFSKITRDLTERKRHEDILVKVAELSPNAMMMADARGRIAVVNARFETMFGYKAEEIVGQQVEALMPERYRIGHVAHRHGFQHREAMRPMGLGLDLWARRRDGTDFPVAIGLCSIDVADGKLVLAAISDLTEQRRVEIQMQASLREKEVLLREIYHRVKNNLQVIQSLLSLQARTLPDGVARTVMHETSQRVRAMSLVHEKLYQSKNLSAIALPGYVRGLLEQFADAYLAERRQVELVANVDPVEVGLDTAVPLGLLLTELISNSLKHAFPDGRPGVVTVSCRQAGAGIVLEIADDGVGLPPGFDALATATMGLKLVNSLVKQLDATLAIESGGGARFRVSIPVIH